MPSISYRERRRRTNRAQNAARTLATRNPPVSGMRAAAAVQPQPLCAPALSASLVADVGFDALAAGALVAGALIGTLAAGALVAGALATGRVSTSSGPSAETTSPFFSLQEIRRRIVAASIVIPPTRARIATSCVPRPIPFVHGKVHRTMQTVASRFSTRADRSRAMSALFHGASRTTRAHHRRWFPKRASSRRP